MKLKILSNYGMVAISGKWKETPRLVAEIKKHPLGPPVWAEMESAHIRVEEHGQQRSAVEKVLTDLTELSGVKDNRHDRKARGLRMLLLALAEATDDAERARLFLELDALLFPQQFRITQLSYLEEAGAARDIEKRVTPEILSTLESVRVDDQSLADIYRDWITAGKELGHLVQERAQVEASLGLNGTATSRTSSRKVRVAWIRAVHLLLSVQDILGLSAEAREMLIAPLQKGIDEALQRRARAGTPGAELPDPDGDIDGDLGGDLGGDIDGDLGGDIDGDLGGDLGGDIDSDIDPDGDIDAPTLELMKDTSDGASL